MKTTSSLTVVKLKGFLIAHRLTRMPGNRDERENSKHNMIDNLQHSTFLSMTNNTTHKQHQVQGSFFYSVTIYLTQEKIMFWSRHILTHISDILYLGTLMKRKQLMSANI